MVANFGPSGMAQAVSAFGAPAQQGGGNFAYPYPQDRLVRKEVALGVVREIGPPEDHIGLKYFPFFDVPTDDFIFDYIKGGSTGLAPARAQDAESELAQKDFFISGQGKGSVMDWAIKDHYDPSDINNFRELEVVANQIRSAQGQLPTTLQNQLNELPFKLARDQAERRRRLDNRIEHMIWTSVITNDYAYNDGRVVFNSPWGRPTDQTNQAPKSGVYGGTSHDPIGDWNHVVEFMYERHGVNMKRAIGSRKAVNKFVNSVYWNARISGLITQEGSTPVNLDYLSDSWGPVGALAAVQNATGITFEITDSVYRTRAEGSNVFVNNRYIPEDVIIFLPNEDEIAQYDSNPIGLGKMVTAPHVEGGYQPGFYEWEQTTVDPWSLSKGTGIKAFPIFPHMELTYTMKLDLVTQTNP